MKLCKIQLSALMVTQRFEKSLNKAHTKILWDTLIYVKSKYELLNFPKLNVTMKIIVFTILILFLCINAIANAWQPTAGHRQIPIWPTGKMPDALSNSQPEIFLESHHLVAGKPYGWIKNVSKPTMTLYRPKKNTTHATVIVFPGGGFNGLAIDLEGTEICHWITSEGMACVLLKYRVPDSGPAWHKSCHCNIHPKAPTALEDAQRTISLVRYNAKKWHINPNKIGVIGFSAGGYMVAQVSADFENRAYKPIDAIDHTSCRPDFAMAIYPGHMQKRSTSAEKGTFVLNPDIHFTKDTPPTFIVQAENDPEDNINNSLLYYIALKNASAPVEMHLYATGGHAFGLRKTKYAITRWPTLADVWLKSIGMIA